MPEDRRLAAIMFTDIVGYTALMGKDEEQAFQILRKNREIHRPIIKKYNGEWLKEMGDGILASFRTSSDAVRCAGEIQQIAKKEGIGLRIGIHEGEVVFEGGDVLGDGVNVASRLEEIAEEGCIYVSGAVYKDIKNKTGISAEFIEERNLKNVDEPIKIYRVDCEEVDFENFEISHYGPLRKIKMQFRYYILTVIILGIAVFLIWYYMQEEKELAPTSNAVMEEVDISIAVLPFDNMSGDPDQEFRCDGLTDELIHYLSKISDFGKVVSRNSSMIFKHSDKTTPEIAEILGVQHIIEGSYQKSGERLRITVQLIDAPTDKHIWSQIYDRPEGDIFDIQSDIAQNVAAELKRILTPEEVNKISKRPTDNLEAYSLYLKGLYHINFHTKEDFLEAIDLFKKAIEVDPLFAMAYNKKALCYQFLHRYTMIPFNEGCSNAKEAIRKSLELDPSIGEAYATLGLITASCDWNIYGAEELFKRAINLSPGSAEVYAAYAQYLRWLGRYDESISVAKQALELDPFNIWLPVCYLHAGRHDEAIEYLRKMLELNLGFGWIHPHLALNYMLKGMCQDALKQTEIAESIFKEQGAMYYYVLGIIYAKCGKKEKAFEILRELTEQSEKTDIDPVLPAMIYSALGQKDKAFELLSEAVELNSGQTIYLKCEENSYLIDISDDPRYLDLLRKIGFKVE